MVVKEQNMDIILVPAVSVPPVLWAGYWRHIMNADLMWMRWYDVPDPNFGLVQSVHSDITKQTYYALDQTAAEIVGEITLEQFRGKSAVGHYSVSTRLNYQDKVKVGARVLDIVLYEWKDVEGDPQFLTMIGLTPTPFEKSLRFAEAIGFKPITVIPNAAIVCGKLSDITMLMATYKEAEDA